jgi:hypothetical protein
MLEKTIIIFLLFLGMAENVNGAEKLCPAVQQDTLPDNQSLINGRIWSNHYFMISGDQFLFSNNFLPGTITLKGRTFSDVTLKYDILNDEILIPLDFGRVLQMNKELVDSFMISYNNKTYFFTRSRYVNPELPAGFVNIMYKGKSELAVKYIKKIDRLNTEGNVDNFYQQTRLYFINNNKVTLLRNKRSLYKAIEPYKNRVKIYLKKQMLYIDRNVPDSYIPALNYLDKISQPDSL